MDPDRSPDVIQNHIGIRSKVPQEQISQPNCLFVESFGSSRVQANMRKSMPGQTRSRSQLTHFLRWSLVEGREAAGDPKPQPLNP